MEYLEWYKSVRKSLSRELGVSLDELGSLISDRRLEWFYVVCRNFTVKDSVEFILKWIREQCKSYV